MTLVWSPSYSTQVSDSDAQAYIEAVETADNQQLEVGVAGAINTFVVGCKLDGIWDAIKASCILAGARTVSGAVVPLKGAAPTNFNFVAGDYDRKTGLLGSSNKYLNSNRRNNDDPQDNQHLSCYATTIGNLVALSMLTDNSVAGSSHIGSGNVQSRNSTADTTAMTVGFNGISRSLSASYNHRKSNQSTIFTRTSQTPSSDYIGVLRGANPVGLQGTHRLSFYSIGEALDLAKLNARVSTLMTDIGAAIP